MIPTKYKNFQADLQQGYTIEEACQRNKITFKEAFEKLKYENKIIPTDKKPTRDVTVERYIIKRKNGYTINKTVNGVRKNFGTYESLRDARRIRSHLEKNGWEDVDLEQICNEVKVRRKRRKNGVKKI